MNRDKASIIDINTAAKRILKFSQGLDLAKLSADEEKQSSIMYQIIVIGEATKRLSPAFRDANSSIPWKEIAGMRDILAHQYDKVEIEDLWGVIQSDIPTLIELIKPLLPPQ